MIGRCDSLEIEGKIVCPNDIVLPITVRAILRIHCKVVSRHGF